MMPWAEGTRPVAILAMLTVVVEGKGARNVVTW